MGYEINRLALLETRTQLQFLLEEKCHFPYGEALPIGFEKNIYHVKSPRLMRKVRDINNQVEQLAKELQIKQGNQRKNDPLWQPLLIDIADGATQVSVTHTESWSTKHLSLEEIYAFQTPKHHTPYEIEQAAGNWGKLTLRSLNERSFRLQIDYNDNFTQIRNLCPFAVVLGDIDIIEIPSVHKTGHTNEPLFHIEDHQGNIWLAYPPQNEFGLRELKNKKAIGSI